MTGSKSAFLLVANYSNRTGYAWNNIYRLFSTIAKEVNACGTDVYVSFAEINPPLDCIDVKFKFDVFEFDPGDRRISNFVSFAKTLKKKNIKSVYLTDQPAWCWWYGLLRFYGVKRIIVHSRVSVSDPKPASPEAGLAGILKLLVSRFRLTAADRIYSVSDFVRDRYVNKARFPAKKVTTIMNGIDLEKFKPNIKKTEAGSPVVIFCGARATDHKGIGILIQAAMKLMLKQPGLNFQVRYAGSGPDFQKFQQLVAGSSIEDCFIFLGELNETRTETSEADIIVVPSIWGDACPSTVSEALASGKPLVATRAGGIPEIVGTEENAILVEPGDIAGLATALEKLIASEELRLKLGAKARARAESALDQKLYYETVITQLFDDCGLLRDKGLETITQNKQLRV